jgi:hypothetical protein
MIACFAAHRRSGSARGPRGRSRPTPSAGGSPPPVRPHDTGEGQSTESERTQIINVSLARSFRFARPRSSDWLAYPGGPNCIDGGSAIRRSCGILRRPTVHVGSNLPPARLALRARHCRLHIACGEAGSASASGCTGPVARTANPVRCLRGTGCATQMTRPQFGKFSALVQEIRSQIGPLNLVADLVVQRPFSLQETLRMNLRDPVHE